VLSKTCARKAPSCEYNYRVLSNACINYPVKADVQLRWCESQKHQLCQVENTCSPAGELEALPHHQTFTCLHLCCLGKGQTASSFCSPKVVGKILAVLAMFQKLLAEGNRKMSADQLHYYLFTEMSP